jgi:glycerophosphoryl diester phosphodiesterase
MIIIGHRGASGVAPEHTFASWDRALEDGADYLEQDLQLTADGVLIVLHDDTLDRTARGTGCTGAVRDRTWSEIRDCDVGSWFNDAFPERARPEYAGLHIPTLDAVFERYHGAARFYIETKKPESAPGMEEELIRLLRLHDLLPRHAGDERVIIQSFSTRSLEKIHELAPLLPLVRLFHALEIGWTIRRQLEPLASWVRGIGPHRDDVDAKLLREAHALGLVVHAWTVNQPSDLDRLVTLGVDGVFTDFPALARAHLDRAPARSVPEK